MVIVITGPTATGKTELGVKLARGLNGEIVSADSMQVYKYMDIGTAKPSVDEMRGIPYHLIDFVSPLEDYSVARYINDASVCIDGILSRGKVPIIVGGTGLYIDSLLSGREFSSRGDDELRKSLEEEFDTFGGDVMLKKLHDVDPESAEKLHVNNKKRIIRALEVYETTGKTISLHDKETKLVPPRYRSIKFALNFSERSVLYDRIDRRVDEMISRGLEAEVKTLLEMGVTGSCTSMQAIGYKELLSMECISDAADKIKRESRRYAKRQLTWLKRDKDVIWITWTGTPDYNLGVLKIMEYLYEKK